MTGQREPLDLVGLFMASPSQVLAALREWTDDLIDEMS